MKAAISLPDTLFQQAELIAHQMRMTRSGLYARAIQEFIAHRQKDKIVAALNEVYSEEDSNLGIFETQANRIQLGKEEW